MSDLLQLPPNPTLVIVRPDRIGDAVISSSCLRAVRETFPSSRIYFIARHELKPLFHHMECLTDFLPLLGQREQLRKEWLRKEMNLLAQTFRDLQPDAVVHLHPDWSCYMAAHKAEIPVRIGWRAFPWSWTLSHAFKDVRSEGQRHEGSYNFDLLNLIGVSMPEKLIPEIAPDPEARESLSRKWPWAMAGGGSVVLNAMTARSVRRWPPQRFVQLAQWLMREHGLPVVSIGQTEESQNIFGELDGEELYTALDGKLDLAELAWLLQSGRFLVTCDTGPAHIAAAVGCPQIMIFGRNEPVYGPTRWAALSERASIIAPSGIRRRLFEPKRNFWKRGFESISIEQVQEAVLETLG